MERTCGAHEAHRSVPERTGAYFSSSRNVMLTNFTQQRLLKQELRTISERIPVTATYVCIVKVKITVHGTCRLDEHFQEAHYLDYNSLEYNNYKTHVMKGFGLVFFKICNLNRCDLMQSFLMLPKLLLTLQNKKHCETRPNSNAE